MAGVMLSVAASGAGAPVGTIRFSSGWRAYVLAGTHPARGLPATATPSAAATLVWRHEVAGNLELTFGSVAPGTLVRVAFSETAEYLGVGGTSDWSRLYTSDEHEPTSGETWVDLPGCESDGVCADGDRAFRFARVYVESGAARIVAASVQTTPGAGRPAGWFLSSDDELNRIWYASAYTAQLTVLRNDPSVLGTGCASAGPAPLVVVDGAKRDRCPWAGDLAVTGPSLLLANGTAAVGPLEGTLSLLAAHRQADGYIPASPMASSVLFDYPAYWVLAVDDLMLYRGVAPVTADWPAVASVLDDWYPAFADASGLLEDRGPPGDYAYIARAGPLVAYYNALYAEALRAGAQVAAALGYADAASRWSARAAALAGPFDAAFWDPTAGAFLDSPSGPPVHPQDGNAFAVLAGLASPAQASAALAHLAATALPWGDPLADVDAWAVAPCGNRPSQCVYPFISYFELEARFAAGEDASAFDELRRTWGWMLSPSAGGPGTDWEAIGAGGTVDGFEDAASSLAAGWSTGALPVLTNDVLGIRPTGPGFSTFDAIPHPGTLAWAQGSVPTPAGPITFGWQRSGGGYVVRLEAPRSLVARVGAPVSSPRVLVDGKAVASAADGTVTVRGSHTISFSP